MKCHAVLEGGGVKGIGHVGAVYAFEQQGYEFDMVAGSSAGAIVAACLAVGYHANEMQELLQNVNYLCFRKEDVLDRLGKLGKLCSIFLHYGIYSSAYLEAWLDGLLRKKGVVTFGDVKKVDGTYRLQVTSVDLTTQELLVFPEDLRTFGIDPDRYPIAKAVRMSMSIPIFYEPYQLKDARGQIHYMVDGGMLSNYPMWILDDGERSKQTAIFGFKFVNSEVCQCPHCIQPCENIIDYAKLIVSTLLDAGDNFYISNTKGDRDRSVMIPSIITVNKETKAISTTDFSITEAESNALFENGRRAGEQFLKHWNYARWRRAYRQ